VATCTGIIGPKFGQFFANRGLRDKGETGLERPAGGGQVQVTQIDTGTGVVTTSGFPTSHDFFRARLLPTAPYWRAEARRRPR
jgi:hypothetical protein